MSAQVQGQCPACGWRTLFLGSGGYVTCSGADCPNPTAVADLLLEHMTPNHEVRIHTDGRAFSIVHPMIERLAGALHQCELHAEMAGLGSQLARWKPGAYTVTPEGVWCEVPE